MIFGAAMGKLKREPAIDWERIHHSRSPPIFDDVGQTKKSMLFGKKCVYSNGINCSANFLPKAINNCTNY